MSGAPATAARVGVPPPDSSRPASLVELVAARVEATPDRLAIRDALAARGEATTAQWTWAEVAAASLHLAEALADAGCVAGDRLAHVGTHSPEWFVVDLACLLSGLVHVPLHADAARREHLEQLRWLAPRGVVLSGRTVGLGPRDLADRLVIDLSPNGTHHEARLDAGGWRRLATDRDRLRSRLAAAVTACEPDACATIVLSSGTTGEPRGVMHSQRSLAANAVASAAMFLEDARDVRLSWLPASHLFARTGDAGTALVRGGCLAVAGDRGRILDACEAVSPTVILGVPAFFERLERGVATGRIADLASALGGQVRVCVSGGAPLRRRTAEVFAACGVPLVEGYGLAEAGPVVALANPRIARAGAVGPPVPGVAVKLDARPATRGQLLVQTPSLTMGVISPREPVGRPMPPPVCDGDWLETGDRAEIDDDGQVRITGRIADAIVLASGVKLPPAAVEAALAEDDAVAQVCVVAAGVPRPVAVVVPEPDVLRAALRRMGITVVSRRHAVRHPRVVRWLARRLARRQAALPRSWRVRSFVITDRGFDPSRGEATASLKPRREAIASAYRDQIMRAVDARESSRSREDEAPMNEATTGRRPESWMGGALWSGGDGGFAEAAARAADPLPAAIEAVLERTEAELVRLRSCGRLYDPLTDAPREIPPIADPPPPAFGRFSAEAEAALGEAGFWGLSVPVAFGGSGGSMLDVARAVSRVAAAVPTAAGTLGVHASIGAVSALVGFGSPEQQARLLPALATGRPLSIFGATEPDAGCDLGRVTTRLEGRDGRLLLTGTKMFITGATYGRMMKVLAVRDGTPVVVLVRLPDADTPTFRLRRYPLHPLRHAHNAAPEFDGFEVDPADVIEPAADGDALAVVWHGLNRGRITLAAQAVGTLRMLLAHARDHARRRITWKQPIISRQLIQGRLGRMAASVVACEALAAWSASAIDAGQSGEWEAITAKVVASHCVRDAAIDALGVHGGRAFLVGHPLGDSLHDHFAVTVYEGESDLLGLALFKGLSRLHPAASHGRDTAAWRRALGWLAWRAAAGARPRGDAWLLDARLRGHAAAARRRLGRVAVAIDRAIRRHGRGLAERQLEVAALSAAVRDAISVLAVAHHADASGDDHRLVPADAWCRLALARAAGRTPTADDLAAVAAAGKEAGGSPG